MKRSLAVALKAMLFVSVVLQIPLALAATDADKLNAVHKGLAYLYATQQTGGYWTFAGHEQAATGAAVSAFLGQREQWGDNSAAYQAAVDKGIQYLLSTANTLEVSTRNDGMNVCPGRAGSCVGIYWFGNSRSTFTMSLVSPAIAVYGQAAGVDAVATIVGPLAGMTWGQIGQGITNALAVSQSTNGNRTGGWGSLIPGNGDATNSGTQWAVSSLIYTESLGANTSAVTKDALKVWLHNTLVAVQSKCSQSDATVACLDADTASVLLVVKFADNNSNDTELGKTLSLLGNREKLTAAQRSLFRQPYAMWGVYSSLTAERDVNELNQLDLLSGCRSTVTANSADQSTSSVCSWLVDYQQWLLDSQNRDGSWALSGSPDPLATTFAINVLGKTQMLLRSQQVSESNLSQMSKVGATTGERTFAALSVDQPSSTLASSEATRAAIVAKVRRRIRKGVTSIAVSDDGSTLASAGADKRIIIWSPLTGTQRFAIQGSIGLPTALAFSKAGLLSAGKDSFIRLWDRTSGKELKQLAGHEGAVNAVTASSNGSWLATAGEGTRIMLWDQNTRKLAKVLFGSKDFVNTLAFSPNSKLLASAGDDTNVLLFDVASGKLLFTLLGHSGSIDTVAFSPNGTVLASAGEDTVIHLWDTAKGQQLQVLRGHQAPIRTMAFSPDGRLVASAGEDMQIRLWNVATGALSRTLTGSTAAINTVIFDPLGVFLASASESGDITLWSTLTGTKLITIRVPGAL